MSRKHRSEGELRQASEHLFYEYWMLRSLGNGLASGIAGESAINNALLESFAIHARALLDFLYARESARDDDVVAEDYFKSPEKWQDARPAKGEALESIHGRVGKEVAHLSYKRQTVLPEAKAWDHAAIAEDIGVAFERFRELVSKRLLGPRWQSASGKELDWRSATNTTGTTTAFTVYDPALHAHPVGRQMRRADEFLADSTSE